MQVDHWLPGRHNEADKLYQIVLNIENGKGGYCDSVSYRRENIST
jgi:hypothetical protein